MYSGVNDENNQGAFNDESSLYHYSYSKDREPQPGQPDPSQTSWQPASRPEDPVSPEEPVAYTTGTCQDDPQPPKPEKGSFWKKTGTKVTALVLCCALIGGLCGFGGAFMSMYYAAGWSLDMVAGRGFIALAAQAMGGGECLGGMLSSLVFGFAQALGIKFSAVGLDSNLASPIPYAVTIIGLVIFSLVRRCRARKLHSAAALK